MEKYKHGKRRKIKKITLNFKSQRYRDTFDSFFKVFCKFNNLLQFKVKNLQLYFKFTFLKYFKKVIDKDKRSEYNAITLISVHTLIKVFGA